MTPELAGRRWLGIVPASLSFAGFSVRINRRSQTTDAFRQIDDHGGRFVSPSKVLPLKEKPLTQSTREIETSKMPRPPPPTAGDNTPMQDWTRRVVARRCYTQPGESRRRAASIAESRPIHPYTSASTGKPKRASLHTTAGYNLWRGGRSGNGCFDHRDDDVYWCVPQICGCDHAAHSYIVYGPLRPVATC